MIFWRMKFCEEICQIFHGGFPIYVVLTLSDYSNAKPMVSHVYGFGSALLDRVVCQIVLSVVMSVGDSLFLLSKIGQSIADRHPFFLGVVENAQKRYYHVKTNAVNVYYPVEETIVIVVAEVKISTNPGPSIRFGKI